MDLHDQEAMALAYAIASDLVGSYIGGVWEDHPHLTQDAASRVEDQLDRIAERLRTEAHICVACYDGTKLRDEAQR